MKMHKGIQMLAVSMAAIFWGSFAQGADGTWTSTTTGPWSATGNWSGGTVADGAGFTANFSTIDVPVAGVTVNLDSARTIGNLVFGDTNTGTAGSWVLANNGNAANILTLDVASGSSTITVNSLGAGSTNTATISAVLAGNDGITKDGAGVLVLSGANTFTGGLNITGGTVNIGGNVDSALGFTGGTVSLSNGATLRTTTDSGTTGAGRSLVIGTGGGRLLADGFSPRTFAFGIQGSGVLTLQSASAVVRLNGNNTGFTGTYQLSGSVSFDTANAAPSAANSILINNNGGLVAINSSTAYATAQAWLNSGLIDAASTGGILLTGINNSENVDLTGYSGLFLGSSNLLNLGAPNIVNYSGTITPADSTYRLGAGGTGSTLNLNTANQLTGARNLVVGNGTIGAAVLLSMANNYTGGTTVNSGAQLNIANSGSLGSGAVSVLSGGALRLQGGVTVANALTLASAPATTTLGGLHSNNGANTYSGNITLSSASRIAAANTAGSSLTISGNIALGANALSLLAGSTAAFAGGDIALTGDISGTGSVNKSDATGTLTLSGNNSYSGNTNISSGMVAIGSASALGNGAGTVAFNGGNGLTAGIRSTDGTARTISNAFSISGGNATNTYVFGATSGGTGNLTFTSTGTTSLGTVVRTFQVNNRTQFNGAFSGAGGGIAKTGSGTLILGGTNTYTGATNVNAGTLLINGSLAAGSAVTVASGASLGGGGIINGAVTVNGSLTPGNSVGTLTVANDVTWNGSAGQDWKFELGPVSGTSDLLLLTGAGNDFLKGSGSDFRFDFLNTGVVGTFTLVDWASLTNFDALDFSYTGLASGLIGTFAINGSQLEFTVVPEPSTYALLGLGLGALWILRRRAQKA